MTHPESAPEPTWPAAVETERRRLGLSDMVLRKFSRNFAELSSTGMNVEDAAYLREASERLARFDRLIRLMGLLAPAGTAPRTALEEIYIQSATSAEESPVVLDLREMLAQHWGEWTPALREAEGIPPAT